MAIEYIGYVSTPFGKKGNTDFNDLFEKAIFPAPSAATGESNVLLFRENSPRPGWRSYHRARVERFRGGYRSTESQLLQAIQDNIVASDFVVAVLTDQNPNVMIEVGFAQAQEKIIIYLLTEDQFKGNMPTNLGNLKRLHLYKTHEDLRLNLYNRIQEVIDDLRQEVRWVDIEYYPNREAIKLAQRLKNAKKRIQILTTNLTTVSANYIDAIVFAVKETPGLSVRILTSDPENDFINPRANQLGEDQSGYRMELQGSLESIRAKLRKYPNCQVRTYKDFPVQLWHLIDNHIYIGQSSLLRRTRYNCVFDVSVNTL